MIPAAFVTAWSARAPWPTPAQVEQDLLLSGVLIEMYQDDYLSNGLVFRGGTCLHKLHLPSPRPYSEDLDFVRTTSSGIAPLTKAVTTLGERLGIDEERSIDELEDVRGHSLRQHRLVGEQALAAIGEVPRAARRRPVSVRREDHRRERGLHGQARQLVRHEERLAPPVGVTREHRVGLRNQALPVRGQDPLEGVERGIERPASHEREASQLNEDLVGTGTPRLCYVDAHGIKRRGSDAAAARL